MRVVEDLFRLFPELPRTVRRSTADAIADRRQRVAEVQRTAHVNAARQKAAAGRTRDAVELRRQEHIRRRQ